MDRRLFEPFERWTDAHFDELLKDLTKLVRIPSVARYDDPRTPFGSDCLQALRFMQDLAGEFGLSSRSVADMVAEISDRFAPSPIALWNHLDVVPPGEGWTYTEPFEPLRQGDYLIGRGADDNKGPAMASLYIVRMFRELGIPLRHSLMLCLGTDEEQRMTDAKYYASVQPAAALNMIADCGFPVCYGEKGILDAEIVSSVPLMQIAALQGGTGKNIIPDRAEVIVRTALGEQSLRAQGKSAHSAFPENGVNAVGALCRKLLEQDLLTGTDRQTVAFFEAVCADPGGQTLGISFSDALSGRTTCAGTLISLDKQHRAVLHLNIRYSVSADAEAMLRSLRRTCAENGCTLENAQINPPNYYPPDAPAVKALTSVVHELTGSEAKPYVMSGGTYARRLPNALGFGMGGLKKPDSPFPPGHGAFHQPDEALYIPNLKKAMPIMAMGILAADEVLE